MITGGAGIGKNLRLTQRDCHKAVSVTALARVTARLIAGSIIHSPFAFPIERRKPAPLRPGTNRR